ncbi:hypothetical protein EG856_00710 [Mycoplasmopsis phocirhinis]|uniref:Uncharacterized protein n=1 Tax=Mycoplasmopsis phocirhinis TaxID=142650 RepID=A0A4V0ZAE8_9BACT|nr:hypothetical protein [Mycoplasmopsis phocirhinis]QBF34452.1 hypothetical protein EG856_00710 [Mycoplasmopsis phocirhinis]
MAQNKNASKMVFEAEDMVYQTSNAILLMLEDNYKFFYPLKMAKKKRNGQWEISYYSNFKINVFKQEFNAESKKYETIESIDIDMAQIEKLDSTYRKKV